MRVRAGACIISEGSAGSSMYFIVSGRARVQKIIGRRQTDLQELLPGGIFGYAAFAGERPYPASVTATKDSELYEIKREVYTEALTGDPVRMMEVACAASEWLTETYRRCIERLEEQNGELTMLLQKGSHPGPVKSLAPGFVHHLNNPLSSIYSVAQLLTLEHPEMEEARRIIVQCRTMMDIISDLKAGSKGEGFRGT